MFSIAVTITGLLCQTLRSYKQDISVFWASVSGCLTRLNLELPAKHLSAFCASTAPLVALQDLELSCSALPTREEMAATPVQTIAIALPQLACLSLPGVECRVALHLDSPRLQSLRLDSMHDVVSLDVSAPSLTHLALRNIRLLPTILLSSFLAGMSGLTNLELRTEYPGMYHGVEEVVHLTRLTRLVTTEMHPAGVTSLPGSLRTLIVEGQEVSEGGPSDVRASMWHPETIQVIAPDCNQALYGSDADIPWGMRSLRQWRRRRTPDGLYPSPEVWMQEVFKEVKEAMALNKKPGHRKNRMIVAFRRHVLPEQQGLST